MESFPWWSKEQIKFSEEIRQFVLKVWPRDMETLYTREFPFDIFEKFGANKYPGAAIPKNMEASDWVRPVPVTAPIEKEKMIDEEKLLLLLAEDYRVNPGIFMSREDILERFDVDDMILDTLLSSLEKDGFVKLYRTKKGIELAKATYAGLNRTHPLEYYKWFPKWVSEKRIF